MIVKIKKIIWKPFVPQVWLASNFSVQYHPWNKHHGLENEGNDHRLEKLCTENCMESLHTGVLRVRERTVLVELIEWGKFNNWRTHLTTALCHPRRYSSTPICQHRQISNVKNQSISKQKKLSLENGPGHYCSNNSTSDDETRKTRPIYVSQTS